MMERVPSAALLRQKRTQKKGTKFTLMLVGPRGSGKTTFLNTLCGRDVAELEDLSFDPAVAHKEPGLEFEQIVEELPDDVNGSLTLKFIDTPGFGDNIDNNICFNEILNYIEKQFDDVLAEESRIRRNPRFSDNRVHALIYFIIATGHGLREIDIEFMRLLGSKVNILPVIAKADSLTREELELNKRLITEDIENHNIPIYQFPDEDEEDDEYDDEDEEEEHRKSYNPLRNAVPFAVIGSSKVISDKIGNRIFVREYPWGYVNIEDTKVSDFPLIREVLLSSHMNDLKETTFDYLYENYRTEKLSREMPSRSQSPDGTSSSSLVPPPSFGSNTKQRIISTSSNADSITSRSYLEREEQLRAEEEKLRSIEQRVQEEIAQKRMELLKREQELKELEARLKREASTIDSSSASSIKSES